MITDANKLSSRSQNRPALAWSLVGCTVFDFPEEGGATNLHSTYVDFRLYRGHSVRVSEGAMDVTGDYFTGRDNRIPITDDNGQLVPIAQILALAIDSQGCTAL